MFRRGDALFFVLSSFICVLFDPSGLEVFHFAQIIPTFCEREGGRTCKFTDIFTCGLAAHGHVRVGGGDAGGENRKPNARPLSTESIHIKFDSLASSLLSVSFILSLIVVEFRLVRLFLLLLAEPVPHRKSDWVNLEARFSRLSRLFNT